MTSAAPVVTPGAFLTLHYRLAGPDGGDVINTFNEKPATLSLGSNELAPAIQARLIGLAEGTRTVIENKNLSGPRSFREISGKIFDLRERSMRPSPELPASEVPWWRRSM